MSKKVGAIALCAADTKGVFNSYAIKEPPFYLSTASNGVISKMSLLRRKRTSTLTAFALGETLI